jgi:hypothetical protein
MPRLALLIALLLGPVAQAGPARCASVPGEASLANEDLRFAVVVNDGHLRPSRLDNHLSARSHALDGELFALKLRDGTVIPASAFALATAPSCASLEPLAGAARAADTRPGAEMVAALVSPDGNLRLEWRARLRNGSNYLRQELRIQPARDVDVASVTLIDLALPWASVAGTTDGAPITAGDIFLGFEHPMSVAMVVGGHASALVRRALPLRAGISAEYSSVMGVAQDGQLRRGFAAYLEAERAHPFRTFLHYNSWYDIGYFTPYSEADALGSIESFGRELVVKRHVQLDSFLFDDGWDDTARLWQFHDGFPHGFAPLHSAAARYGAAPGIWLSPWGGYGAPRRARLATARAAGYEVDEQGLALSGPRYYPLFHATTLALLKDGGINQFKLDGVGSPDKVTPGSTFDSDFAAAMALIEDLRRESPSLYINLTTGTWPSPFWLRSVDSIWRGGEDHLFAGEGSDRRRWITYRDADTYGGIVRQSPLYPLNALMLHGIIYARHARGLDVDPGGDLAGEAWSYFASGTGLQELYVTAALLSEHDWDTLASAARWARERAPVLIDSHWIGGDPARGEVYGWAAWTPERAIVALRNPLTRPQRYALDLARAFELPEHAPRVYRGAAAYGREAPRRLSADEKLGVSLNSGEVLVWDFVPEAREARPAAP